MIQTTEVSALPLNKELRRAVSRMGITELTPIQAEAIPPILEGKDVIGQARTGTGKTLAFGIPLLQMLAPESRQLEGLVLCPTRELAVQVTEELRKLSWYRRDVRVVPVYGGQPIERQFAELRRGPRIVVGTPGRIIDHMTRGTLTLATVTRVVLDEADRMLDMGFLDDIELILSGIRGERQTLLFSATMPKPIMTLAHKHQKEPHHVNVIEGQMTVPEIEQMYFEVRHGTKLKLMCRVIEDYNLRTSLIFCNTKRRVNEIARDLQTLGYRVESLHGDMPQSRRDRAMTKFRKRISKILVATDVAARGLDVDGIDAVINYDIPMGDEDYVHRIGRTARMGKTGKAITLALSSELRRLRQIQSITGSRIQRRQIAVVKGGEMAQAS